MAQCLKGRNDGVNRDAVHNAEKYSAVLAHKFLSESGRNAVVAVHKLQL